MVYIFSDVLSGFSISSKSNLECVGNLRYVGQADYVSILSLYETRHRIVYHVEYTASMSSL